MSASLVGSEMCIRDSFSTLAKGSVGAVAARARDRWTEPVLRHPKNLRAVSYTHLTLPTICSV
eukprot:15280230-Alexandrium_andersonii.AAC.1